MSWTIEVEEEQALLMSWPIEVEEEQAVLKMVLAWPRLYPLD
jgi:hypothetical protein